MTGTPRRNTDPHQNWWRSIPPTTGPSAVPAAKQVIHTETARVRCRGWVNRVRMSDRVEGMRVAPATPSSARLRIRVRAVGENAASTEATPKAAEPINSRRRRPMRSPRVPIVMSVPAMRNP